VLYGYVDAFVEFMGNVYMVMGWIYAVNIGFLYPAGLYKWCRIQLGTECQIEYHLLGLSIRTGILFLLVAFVAGSQVVLDKDI
jgi:hypothetical protein